MRENGKEKKSMSTQVDYVALIMAKHDDVNRDKADEEKLLAENELEQSTSGMTTQQANRIKKKSFLSERVVHVGAQ